MGRRSVILSNNTFRIESFGVMKLVQLLYQEFLKLFQYNLFEVATFIGSLVIMLWNIYLATKIRENIILFYLFILTVKNNKKSVDKGFIHDDYKNLNSKQRSSR